MKNQRYVYTILYPPAGIRRYVLLALDGYYWNTLKGAQTFNRQAGTRGQIVKVKLWKY